MAVNKSNQQKNNNTADAFLNLQVVDANGVERQLGGIPLRENIAVHRAIMEKWEKCEESGEDFVLNLSIASLRQNESDVEIVL